MKEKKTCSNCKYFVQYYIKCDTRISVVNSGHCINKQKPKDPLFKCCEYWESAESEKKERRQSIKSVLQKMSERLEEIAIILNNDEN